MPDRVVDEHIPVGLEHIELECVTTEAGDLWIPTCDEVMRDHMRNAGSWEPEVGRVLLGAMPSGSGAVFVDIGANIGYFSLLVANRFPEATVHAFEPNPVTYRVLRLNTWCCGDRIRSWPLALSDSRGTVALTTSAHNLGDTKSMRVTSNTIANSVAPSISLDDFAEVARADLVKIDVQGAELSVFAGMKRLIAASPRIRIVMEFAPGFLKSNKVDPVGVLAALRADGFVIHLIGRDTLSLASNAEVIQFCQSAGISGQANLLLSRQQ